MTVLYARRESFAEVVTSLCDLDAKNVWDDERKERMSAKKVFIKKPRRGVLLGIGNVDVFPAWRGSLGGAVLTAANYLFGFETRNVDGAGVA